MSGKCGWPVCHELLPWGPVAQDKSPSPHPMGRRGRAVPDEGHPAGTVPAVGASSLDCPSTMMRRQPFWCQMDRGVPAPANHPQARVEETARSFHNRSQFPRVQPHALAAPAEVDLHRVACLRGQLLATLRAMHPVQFLQARLFRPRLRLLFLLQPRQPFCNSCTQMYSSLVLECFITPLAPFVLSKQHLHRG
jgi:hypothetical protein